MQDIVVLCHIWSSRVAQICIQSNHNRELNIYDPLSATLLKPVHLSGVQLHIILMGCCTKMMQVGARNCHSKRVNNVCSWKSSQIRMNNQAGICMNITTIYVHHLACFCWVLLILATLLSPTQ